MNFTCNNSTAKLNEMLAIHDKKRKERRKYYVKIEMSCSVIHTSFSLNDKRFEEFGEGDRPVADTELLMLLVVCLGTLLLYCIDCLYTFYHGGKGNYSIRN